MKYLYLLIAILLVSSTNAQQNVSVSLDTTFNHTGIVTLGTDTTIDYGALIESQSDGKVVLGGAVSNLNGVSNAVLIRYNMNGQPDNTFGINGKVTFPSTNNYRVNYSTFKITPNDRILFAGNVQQNLTNNPSLFKLKPNGSADSTFGVNGVYKLNILNVLPNTSGGYFANIIIQDDGKIVLGGNVITMVNQVYTAHILLVRLNENGTPDNTFGNNGIVAINNATYDKTSAIAIQGDKIVIGASTSTYYNSFDSKFLVVRLNSNGTLDNTFGNGGSITHSFMVNDICWALAVHKTNGRIYLSGQTPISINSPNCFYGIVICLNGIGSLDNTFSDDGVIIRTDSTSLINSMVIQNDDKILLGSNLNSTVYRLNSNGVPDTTFGTDGDITTPLNQLYSSSRSMVMQPDGKIVTGGSYWSYLAEPQGQGNWDFVMVKYNCTDCINIPNTIENKPQTEPGLSIYPNPSNSNFTLSINSDKQSTGKIELINPMGQLAYEQTLNLSMGENKIPMQASLPGGVYFVRISTHGGIYSTKLSVVRQ
jgi:uncharacterized delta-60 repeat protein